MTRETREGAGGWEVPSSPDGDGLKEAMIEGHVTFRKSAGGFDVFLDGNENVDIWQLASCHGFAVADITVAGEPFDAKVRLDGKQLARQSADAKENSYRLPDEE